MHISLGNLKFEDIGDKKEMLELEGKLHAMGYSREANCEKNKDTSRLTYHIFDMPKKKNYSDLTDEVIAVLSKYSTNFRCRIAVTAEIKAENV